MSAEESLMAALHLDEQAIFEVARKIAAREAREAYLQQVCGDEAALGQRVRALLKALEEGASFLEAPASRLVRTVDEPITEGPGTVIGPYKLMEQIGEGGMGLVFVAEQQHPVRRKVALKVIKPGMDTRQVIARFEAERQALALMDHPNIAKVLDAGTIGSEPRTLVSGADEPLTSVRGSERPYFVMELVKGVPITDYCDENQLPLRDRLELFLHVCQAVQHAHQKGIIHRDIKPSNVLVMSHDGTPLVKVIDFGIAKAIGQQLTDKTIYTQFAQLVGTPLYMSPEQAGQSGLDVDTRSDIYSLGVLLYELLTGTTPFDKERLKEAGYDEMRRIIREEEPARPSTRISTLGQAASTISAQRRSDPRQLSRQFRGELDWIVMKALEKDRNRRYETASGLARDIERYLNDEPVQACPPSSWYRMRKMARRHKGKLMAAAAMLVLLLAGAAVSTWQAVRATHAEWETGEALQQVNAEQARTQDGLTKLTAEQARTQNALTAVTAAEAQTREALDALTDDVVARMFASHPELDEADKAFLRKVLGLYEAFTEPAAKTAQARFTRANGYYQVARLRAWLGKLDEAVTGFRQAEALLEQLREEDPKALHYRDRLARTRYSLGEVLGRLMKPAEAETALRQAIALRTELRKRFPELLQYQRDLAATYHDLGVLLVLLENYADAETAYRESMHLWEEIVARAKGVPDARLDLARTRTNWAHSLWKQGNYPEAEKVLRQVVEVQKKHLKKNSGPRRRYELAFSQGEWGNVLAELKRPDEAEKALGQAIDLLEKLKVEFPGIVEYRQNLANNYHDLGVLFFRQRDFVKAENAYSQALTDFKALLAEGSTIPDHRKGLAVSYVGLATLFQAQEKKGDAEQTYLKALPDQRKLAADFPKVAGYHTDLVVTLGKLAGLAQPPDGVLLLEEAEKHALAALEISHKNPTSRRLLAYTYVALGDAFVAQNKNPVAEETYRKALPLQRPLTDEFPLVAGYHNDLVNTLWKLSVLEARPQDVVRLLEEAKRHVLAALKISDKDPAARRFYPNVLGYLAKVHLALGDHVNLAAIAKEGADCGHDPPNDTYVSARLLCRCAMLADKHAQRTDSERRDLIQRYADRALAQLQKAVARGFKAAARMKNDPELQPLRARPAFKQLLAELEAKQKE
jgi:serine/threonine protein kinase/tetratricopeptide (TPR) repeat protein